MNDEIKRVAERAMPGWKAVDPDEVEIFNRLRPRRVDSVGVSFEETRAAQGLEPRPAPLVIEPDDGRSGMVMMQSGANPNLRRAVVVANGRIIGAQG